MFCPETLWDSASKGLPPKPGYHDNIALCICHSAISKHEGIDVLQSLTFTVVAFWFCDVQVEAA